MKKRIPAFLLCVLLLTGSVFAEAGSADDPLISLSYLSDVFLPEVRDSLASVADKAVRDYLRGAEAESEPAARDVTLKAGEGLELREGAYFVLTSGTATLSVTRGTAVNATLGRESSGGAVRIGNRYIICENSSAFLDAGSECTLTVSGGAEKSLGCPFSDVKRSDWFYADVANAVARGLVDGMTPTTYVPGGTLTAGQAVKLAACMHQLYYEGEVTLRNSAEGAWYRSYVDYALENGILTQEFANYNAAISRRQFVQVFYRALPPRNYTAINIIPDDAIPDLGISDPGGEEIYAFYRAGILSGYTKTPGYAEYAFGPDSSINRAEVAAIMSRMFDKTVRLSFEIR